jgi:hypothetical protein
MIFLSKMISVAIWLGAGKTKLGTASSLTNISHAARMAVASKSGAATPLTRDHETAAAR